MVKKTKITYYGQSLFLIESSDNIKIGIDPYNKLFRAKLPNIKADIALVTHHHPDHSNISLLKGNPEVIKTMGTKVVKGIIIEGLPSHHGLRKFFRFKNIIFKINVDNIIFCHLGDLGYIPDDDILNKLKDIDILFIPIGGTFTINYKIAYELIKIITPSIAIPMHYTEKFSRIKVLDKIDNFLTMFKDYKVIDSTTSLRKDNLPKNSELWILEA